MNYEITGTMADPGKRRVRWNEARRGYNHEQEGTERYNWGGEGGERQFKEGTFIP